MQVTCVAVFVKPEHVQDFIRATQANHDGSVREPGNLRFDVLQSREDPARFLLYEAYRSEEAAAAHKQTEHYRRWKDAVEPWMAQPRSGTVYRVVSPRDPEQW